MGRRSEAMICQESWISRLMYKDFFMQNLWRWSAGMPEIEIATHRFSVSRRCSCSSFDPGPDARPAAESNWFPEAISLMRNRMLVGVYRYGHFLDPDQLKYDRIRSAIERIRLYHKDGNGEHLIDAMNMLGIEFRLRAHPRFHFTASDDGVHAQVKVP